MYGILVGLKDFSYLDTMSLYLKKKDYQKEHSTYS